MYRYYFIRPLLRHINRSLYQKSLRKGTKWNSHYITYYVFVWKSNLQIVRTCVCVYNFQSHACFYQFQCWITIHIWPSSNIRRTYERAQRVSLWIWYLPIFYKIIHISDKYYVNIDKRYLDTSDPFVKAISL